MKSLKRLFGRMSTRKVTRRLPFRISRPIGYASHVERLEDRTLLASNILASLESSVNQPNDTTELLLNVGPGSSPTLGFEVHATAGSAFNPAAIQLINTSTHAVIPLNLAENDHAGTNNSLTLATLAPGEYSLLVHGQTSATGGFIIDVFLPGDTDGSGSVTDTEYQHALAASYQNLFGFNHYTTQFLIQQMGLNPNTNFYSQELDGDMDGDVDNYDLQMMNSNRNIPPIQLELIGDQDAPAVDAGLEVDSGISDSDGVTNELTIVGTVTDESLITQFKVSLDGGSFVDIFGQLSGGASGGTFTLTRGWLETNLNGGNSLEGGTHTLHFMTVDEHDNISAAGAFDVNFELDTIAPLWTSSMNNLDGLEDFAESNLGLMTDFFDPQGGTPLYYEVDSFTNSPLVEFDFSTGEFIVRSIPDAFGTSDYVLRATDLAGNFVLSNIINVDISAVNDAPVAVDGDATAFEDFLNNFPAPGVLTFVTDVENDTLTVTEVNGSAGNVATPITIGAGGELNVAADGSFTFDPKGAYESLAAGETATETFTYTVSDGNGGTDTATITITIEGANDAPVANTDFGLTDEDTATGGDVLTNDTDIDTSDNLTVTGINQGGTTGTIGSAFTLASGAIVTLQADGTYEYNPNGAFEYLSVNESATDTFTYTIDDGNGGTDTATVTITVNGVNDAPVAENDVFTTDEDTVIFNANLFADTGNGADSDVDQSDSFTVTGISEGVATGTVGSAFTLASGATVLIRVNGTFDYNPNGAFEGLGVNESDTDTFTYTIDDGNGGTDTATVTITINGVNDAPVAQDDELSTDEDTVLNGDLFADNNHGQDSDADDNDSFTIVEVNGQTADVGQTITLGTGALLTVNSDGTFSYNPNGVYEELGLNYLTGDNFTYKIQDSQGATDTAFVSISIDGVNDAPTVAGVSISAVEDGPTVNGSFAGDDIDADDNQGSLTYTITIDPAEGTVVNNNDGTFTFNPGSDFQDLAEGETRLATFTYTATDSHGAVSGTQSVTVTVTGVNDTPTAAADSLAATEDGGTVTTGVLTDDVDSDDDADTLIYSIMSQPSEGTASANGDGTFTFDPGSDFQDLYAGETREVSFSYSATDSHGLFATGTVTVTVTGVNDPPTAADDSLAATEDLGAVTTGVLADDVDNDDDANSLVYAITAQPSEGTASSNGDGTFTFDPGSDFQDLYVGETREVSFTYTATDSHGIVSNTGTVTVTVTGVNDPPTAGDVGIGAVEDGAPVTTGVLADDVDNDDDAGTLIYSIITQPTEGSASSNGDGTFTFDPGSDFQDLYVGETREVSFVYTATDQHGLFATGTVTVTVTGVNDPPTAADLATGAIEDDTPITTGVLAGDVDNDDDASTLIYAITTQPGEGTAISNDDGTFTFDPGSDFQDLYAGETREVSFTYTATDSHGIVSNTGTVTVTVTGVNDPPTAGDDNIAATEDGGTVTTGVLADDVDNDDDADSLVYSITAQPSEGTASSNGNGTFTFDPGSDFQDLYEGETREVTFTYTATDSHGIVSTTGTVTVTVTGVNDAPTAGDDSLAANEDGVTVTTGVLADDVDNDDNADSLNYTITAQPSEGAASSNGDGTFTFDPGSDFQDLAFGETREVSFTYTATDQHGAVSNTGTVTVVVTGVNDAPTANADAIDVNKDIVFNGSVLANNGSGIDSDPDTSDNALLFISELNGNALVDGATVTLVSGAEVTMNANGTFSYNPLTLDQSIRDTLVGPTTFVDSFSYQLNDTHGGVDTATVTITVSANQLPIAGPDSASTLEDDPILNIDVLGNDSDPDQITDPPVVDSLPSLTSSAGATLQLNGDGTINYDPAGVFNYLQAGETTTDTFTYTLKDERGGLSVGTVTVTITGVNDAPTAQNDDITTDENNSISGNLITDNNGNGADSDPDTLDVLNIVEINGVGASVGNQITLDTGALLTVNADGTFNYDPNGQFDSLPVSVNGSDSFTYKISDGHGGTDTATVNIVITGVNDNPVVVDVNVGTLEDSGGVTGSYIGSDVDDDEDGSGLVYSMTATYAGLGSAVDNNDGTFTYFPGSDFQDLAVGETSTISFNYIATDTHNGISNIGTVYVTVTGVNDLPTAGDSTLAATEDGSAVTTGVLTDDVDSDDDANSLNYTITAQPSEGTASSNGDGTFTFDPGSDFQDLYVGETREVSFTYTATDSHSGVSSVGTVTVTVTGVNDLPTAGDDTLAATEDGGTVTTGVLADDVDNDDDANSLVYAITAQPSEGTASSNGDGTFIFDPGSDFQDLYVGETREVSFTYTATDSHSGVSSVGTVTVTVTGVNDPPTAAAVGVGAVEDGATVNGSFNGDDVDNDDSSSTLTYAITAQPGEGSVVNNNNGTFTFDPGSDFQDLYVGETREVTFTYTATDSHGLVSNTGTVTVTVTGVNDLPTAGDDTLTATEDGGTVTTGVLAGDVDNDDDASTLIYAITAQPSEGTASSNGDGTFTFDPGSDFQDLYVGETREVSFTYTATDSHSGVSSVGTVTITVTGVNDSPTAAAVGVGAVEDGATVNGSFNGDDVDNDDSSSTLTYVITAQPGEGSVVNNNNGTFTFDPGSDFQDLYVGETREVTFTYTATDSHGLVSNTGTVTVTVTGVNDAPTAGDDTLAATEDGGTVTTGVLADDVDNDDDANSLIYAITAQPSEGTASSNGDGTFTFDPGSDFQDLYVGETREVSFTFTATDSHGLVSNTGTVTVTVTGVNDPPTAADLAIDAIEDDTPVTTGVLADDVDNDDDANSLVYAITAQPSEGTASSNGDGTFTFAPGSDFQDLYVGETREVSFTYTATDSHSGVSSVGTVTVTVTGVNDAPTAGDDILAATEDGGTVTTGVLANDVDNDDDANSLIYAITAQPSEGTATSNGDGTFTFDPGSDFQDLYVGETREVSFTFTATDSHGVVSNTGTVTVTVTGVNDNPTVNDIYYSADEDGSVITGFFDGNDVDSDDDANSLTYVISPTYAGEGSVVNNDDGSFSFDPETDFQYLAAGETTVVSFTYTAIDSHTGSSNTGTVYVTVTGVNDPVDAINDSANVSKNGTVNIDVLGNDVDVDVTDTLTVTLIDGQSVTNPGDFVTLTSGATVTLESDGTLTYDPNGIFPDLLPPNTQPDSFEYTVSDGTVTDTATVNITISGSNELLVLTDPLTNISRDGLTSPETIDLDLHFDDPDAGDTVTYMVEAHAEGDMVGDALPANFWANVVVSGSDLNITYTDYSPNQVRLPLVITVTAHSDDTISGDVTSTFTLTPDAQATTEIRLIARPVASSGTDFTYFRASTTVDTVLAGGKGAAVFNLTNGQQDLNYTIGGLTDYNNSNISNGPIVDIQSDLIAVRIVDTTNSNSTVFTIYHKTNADDDPTVDLAEGLISGVWASDDSTAFTSAILDKLYNGDLAVQVEITGLGKKILTGNNIGVSPEVDNVGLLPSEQTEYYVGQDYVVEVWISDQLQQLLGSGANTGFSGALVTLTWAGAGNIPEALAANIMGEASTLSLNSGNDQINIDNDGNVIVEFNGSVTSFPAGVGGTYARIGYAQFKAFDATPNGVPIDFSVDLSVPESLQRAGEGSVNSSQISVVNAQVVQKQTYQFEVQTDQSNISVSGSVNTGSEVINLSPQNIGFDESTISGRVSVALDDLNNPTTIKIVDSVAEINPTGQVNPDRGATGTLSDFDLADFGLQGTTTLGGDLYVALRDVIASMFSSESTLSGGSFDIQDPWTLDHGQIDSFAAFFNGLLISSRNSDTASNLELTFFNPGGSPPAGLSSWTEAELTDLGSGIYQLVVPISRTLTFTDSTGAVITLNFTGSITSTFDTSQSDKYGDTTGTATDTTLSNSNPGTQVYQGVIGNNETLDDPLVDVDMFKVQLNAGDSVTVDVDADMFNTGLDSVVYIFDASGNIVAFSDNDLAPDEFLVTYGENDSYVTFTAGAAGNYYIGVSALNGAYTDSTSYDPLDISSHDNAGNLQVSAFDGGGYDLTITVTTGGAPLHGTQSVTNEQVLNEGTAVDLVVVQNQTAVDSSGHISGLPVSDTWIDEWSSFWVEIYVETADADSITDATVDLNYNTNFFTATEIEFSRAFSDNGTAVIDDTTGVVTGLNGTAALDRVGNYNKALLARVKFESLAQDDVSIDFEDKFIGPHALGLSLSNVEVGLAGDVETQIIVGDAPQTDLWAIAFDVNDDDIINYRDLIMLASVYGQNVLDTNSPYVWALDSDKSGTVNYRDLTFLVTNYGVHKGGDKQVVYPSNFLQRWYGQTTDITGDSSIDQVMDEALGIWQDALGLEEPLDIQLVITNLGGTQLGEGQITGVDSEGRPVSGIVTLDDNAAGLGWYSDLDSSAFSDTALEGGVSYTADAGSAAAGHYDLLTVLLHEIGHVLGFSDTYAPFESFVQIGVGGTMTFVGSGFEATLTDDGLHLDDTVHAGDVMNATLDPGVRKLPSILDTLILQSAHEAAASGSYEILVGVNAPLTATLPLVAEPPVTQSSENENSLVTVIAPLDELSPVVFDVTSSLQAGDEPVQHAWNQVINNLLQSQGLEQGELDLTVLEGLSEELINDLRLNGLSIVDGGKIDLSDLFDVETGDLDLAGLNEEVGADFDDVFSDWAGPIL